MTENKATICAVSAVVVALVAAMFALYFGSELLVPLAFAFLLNAMFRPVVRGLERARVPSALGAAIVVIGLVAFLTALGYALSYPIETWMREVPQRIAQAQSRLETLRRPIERVTATLEKVESAARGSSTMPASAPADGQPPRARSTTQASTPPTVPPMPQASPPSVPPMFARVLGTTTTLIAAVVEVLLMLYLLLAAGDLFVDKLVKSISSLRDKKLAVQVVADVQVAVMRYMLVTALINVAQAIAVGLALWWIGMPNPLLWALFTFLLEFIPYLGGTVMVALLTIIGLATFDNLLQVLAAPASYLLITSIQNNIVSPIAYGKRLKLNPVAVLIGVLFWWFIWGIGGAFLAVPIIAAVKIICDRTRSCRALGEFLSE